MVVNTAMVVDEGSDFHERATKNTITQAYNHAKQLLTWSKIGLIASSGLFGLIVLFDVQSRVGTWIFWSWVARYSFQIDSLLFL